MKMFYYVYLNSFVSIPQLLWFLKLGEDVSNFFPSFFLAVILWTSQVVSYPCFSFSQNKRMPVFIPFLVVICDYKGIS